MENGEFMIDLSTLNDSQKQAVTTHEQYVRVIAGAGSGKTRVLTNRITYLIEQLGVIPRSILAITFTNKAAQEMKKRVVAMLQVDSTEVTLSTFHSFCVRVLREDIRVLHYPREFTIIDDDDQERIMKELFQKHNINKEVFSPRSVLNYISNNKSAGIGVAQAQKSAQSFYGEEIKAQMFEAYETYLAKYFYLDFDDLIAKTVKIFKDFPQIKEKWRSRLSYILVDEFQDTNDIQYQLLKDLTGPHTHLFVVGDPDQTIYTWRGANVDIMLDFHKHFKGCIDIVLNKNYRSTKNILSGANRLINNNKFRIPKDLFSDKMEGGSILYYQAQSPEMEAWWIIERIKELRSKNPNTQYRDFAILYRSTYYTSSVEKEMIQQQVPYRIYGGTKFFERKEIKDALSYLRLIARHDDDGAFKRIVNQPRRGLGEKGLEQLENIASRNGTSLFQALKEEYGHLRCNHEMMSAFFDGMHQAELDLESEGVQFASLLENVLDQVGYIAYLKDANEEDRIESIKELGNYFMSFQSNYPGARLHELLQEISLYTAQDEMSDDDFISLMTVHTAKGLEFPYVFVIGLTEGIFPNQRALEEEHRGVEEERRLAYVAFTRAMKQLFLSDSLGFNFVTRSYRQTSRFVAEAGDSVKPYYTTKKSNEILEGTRTKPTVTTENFDRARAPLDVRPGDRILHTIFGDGIVISVSPGIIKIAFKDDKIGVRQISSTFAGMQKG